MAKTMNEMKTKKLVIEAYEKAIDEILSMIESKNDSIEYNEKKINGDIDKYKEDNPECTKKDIENFIESHWRTEDIANYRNEIAAYNKAIENITKLA